jgi:hypothetical protein
MISHGDSTMTVLDLCNGRKVKFPLQWINTIIENTNWNTDDDINLWTYADCNKVYSTSNKYGFEAYSLWADTIDRILLADKEIEQILGNCKNLIPVFKTRKK